MRPDLARGVLFGVAGIIDLGGDNDSPLKDLRGLVECFEENPESVSVTWHGKGIAAVAVQHTEDAQVVPGEYVLPIPEVNGCQGILVGHFFAERRTATGSGDGLERASATMVSRYTDQGASALARLNGMWIGVIWDKAQRRALFARDAVGAETLYVVPGRSRILFGSDLRLLRVLGGPSEIDRQAVAEFLHYLYVPAPRTIYRNVRAVLPGHVLRVEQDTSYQQRFAPPRFVQGVELADPGAVSDAFTKYLPRFEEALYSAAEDCLPKHGRIGLLLSGGKDSSALAVMLRELAPDRTVCLTVGAQDPQVDESTDAARLCQFLGLPQILYTPTREKLTSGFQHMIASQDQPSGDTASLPLFLALDELPEDITMVWDGTGNDYYFGFLREAEGLRYLRRVRLESSLPKPLWWTLLFLMRLGPRRFRGTAQEWSQPAEESFVAWNGWTARELEALFERPISFADTELWRVMRNYPAEEWVRLQTETLGGVWEPHTAYRKGVQATRAYGKAGRYPFIDNRLATIVNGLPRQLQYDGYTNKTLLRAFLAKHLPDDLLRKPKGYFVFDPRLVLGQGGAGWLHALADRNLLRALPGWSDRPIRALLDRYGREPRRSVEKAYALALMASWIAHTNGRPSPPAV